jgi:hypothetical protein
VPHRHRPERPRPAETLRRQRNSPRLSATQQFSTPHLPHRIGRV